MTLEQFIHTLNQAPNTIQFSDTIAVIEANYQFEPTAFKNGELTNEAGQNSGSCKIFSFAQLHNLSANQTLNCFGDYYRIDVAEHPEAQDHQNIRNFIEFGWAGIKFHGVALTRR